MNEEKISYYELLGMIKDIEDNSLIPKVYYHNNAKAKTLYIPCFDCVSNEFQGYHIKDKNMEDDDTRYWLSECMLESSMFDKCLEIKQVIPRTDIKKEISKLQSEIDKLGNEIALYHNTIHSMRDRNNYMKQKLKHINMSVKEILKENYEKDNNWNYVNISAYNTSTSKRE